MTKNGGHLVLTLSTKWLRQTRSKRAKLPMTYPGQDQLTDESRTGSPVRWPHGNDIFHRRPLCQVGGRQRCMHQVSRGHRETSRGPQFLSPFVSPNQPRDQKPPQSGLVFDLTLASSIAEIPCDAAEEQACKFGIWVPMETSISNQ
jgi:hypothetical protein